MAQERKRYNVGVVKLPYAERDVAHSVITEDDPREFFDVIGADTPDDDEVFPVGSDCTYSVELTEQEAEAFAAASNCRYIEEDGVHYRNLGATAIPDPGTLTYMGAAFAGSGAWHGQGVPIAVCDEGTTAAVREYMGWTLLARQYFPPGEPPSGEVWPGGTHGCLVAPCAVPMGGQILDLMIARSDGGAPTSASAAAWRYAADEGCKIVVYSWSGDQPASVLRDAAAYCQARDVQVFCSAGNDSAATLSYPAADCAAYPNIHGIINFSEFTDKRSPTSNHAAFATGCAPGVEVYGLSPTASLMIWSGTSASAPHAARLCAQGATGGVHSPKEVAAALRANLRNTGQPASQQGGGAFHLQNALTALTKASGTNLVRTGTTSDAFSATVTTAKDGSVVSWLGADWVPVTTGAPGYRSSAIANAERRTANVNYWSASQAAPTAGPQTVGMTSPTGQKWSLLAVELKPVD